MIDCIPIVLLTIDIVCHLKTHDLLSLRLVCKHFAVNLMKQVYALRIQHIYKQKQLQLHRPCWIDPLERNTRYQSEIFVRSRGFLKVENKRLYFQDACDYKQTYKTNIHANAVITLIEFNQFWPRRNIKMVYGIGKGIGFNSWPKHFEFDLTCGEAIFIEPYDSQEHFKGQLVIEYYTLTTSLTTIHMNS